MPAVVSALGGLVGLQCFEDTGEGLEDVQAWGGSRDWGFGVFDLRRSRL